MSGKQSNMKTSGQSNVISSGQDRLLSYDELEERLEDFTENTANPDTMEGSADTQETDQSAAESSNGTQVDILEENSISYNDNDDVQRELDFLAALDLQQQQENEKEVSYGGGRKRAASPEATDQTEAKRQRCDHIESLLCRCCFQVNTKCILCPAGHIVCKKCVKFLIWQSITSDEISLTCPVDSCGEEISIDSLSPLEPNLLIELLKEHVRKKEALAPQNLIQDIVEKTTCPKCQSSVVLEEGKVFFQCIGNNCNGIFCRFCQRVATTAFLPMFEKAHESCRILQYGGPSSPSDLSALPVHWDAFTDEDKEVIQRNDNTNETFDTEGLFHFFGTRIIPVFPDDIPNGVMGGYKKVKLSPVAREFRDIKSYFQKSSTKVVTDIYRVQNINSWEKYVIKRKHLVNEVGAHNINERMLYHGTSREALGLIIKEGFDFRRLSVTGRRLGNGMYFSARARDSEDFAKSNFLLMACVLEGRSTRGHRTYFHPPYDRTTGKMFHSCVDVLPHPTMFVVFANDQCYPAYIIEYQ